MDGVWINECPPEPKDDIEYKRWERDWNYGFSKIMLENIQIGEVNFTVHKETSEMTIGQIEVFPKFQKKGYGKKAVNELIEIAKRESCTLIRTSTPVLKDTPADYMWQKSGFEVVRENTLDNGFKERYFEKKI